MMVRVISVTRSSSRNSSSGYYHKGNNSLLHTLVRVAATTAAATTTTSVSGAGAFSFSQGPFRKLQPSSTTGTASAISVIGWPPSAVAISAAEPTTRRRPSIGQRGRSGLMSSLSESRESSPSDHRSGPQPLETLCSATLQACQAVTPAVEALYRSISNSNSDSDNKTKTSVKTKADDSVFTIADGLVQHLLTEVLFGEQTVGEIVGEEDCAVNLETKPYTVDDLVVPSEFEDSIERAIEGVTRAREALVASQNPTDGRLYPSLTAFIDPIDGTREFSTGKGEQCSICVGFADTETGMPVAGVVYRPLSTPHPTWAAGAKEEAFAESSLDTATTAAPASKGSLLTTNGRISPFLESLMEELGYERMPSGGAGNKMLMLLEGKGTAYIQDRGVSRWDTCAAQAVLEAHGGILGRLDGFLEDGNGAASSYTYRQTDRNLDFVPGAARLTKYNAASGIDTDSAKSGMATTPREVKPYANLCGLVALGKSNNNQESLARIWNGMKRASESSPPAFD